MNHLEIILPIALLIIAFLLKLMIDRSVDIPIAIQSLCELPVDTMFLSISFIVAFTISSADSKNSGLFFCFIYIIIAVIVVFIWRRTVKIYEDKNSNLWIILLFINFIIAVFALVNSVKTIISI